MERQSYLPNRREYLKKSADEHREIITAVQMCDGAKASELIHVPFARHEEGENDYGNSS
jgi:DNA-binding GntR family transcriptional regulator